VEQDGQNTVPVEIEAPRGTPSSRVDEKGRLKLPVSIGQYLEAFGDKKFFVTTLDGSTALIYPISVWRESEKILQEPGDDADVRADIAFLANHYGEDVEIDAQGRILMPALLRRELGLEKDDVHLVCYKQRIEVLGSKIYSERLESARANLPEKLKALAKKGLR
jgi:MraZ protein